MRLACQSSGSTICAHGEHPRGSHRRQHEGAHGSYGYASPRAALIYQHATRDRDAAIAKALSDTISNAAQAPTADVVTMRPTADASDN